MAASPQGAAYSTSMAGSEFTSQSSVLSQDPVPQTLQIHYLTINDLKAVAADIKDSFAVAITELRQDIQSLTGRIQNIEKTSSLHDAALIATHQSIDTHTLQLRDLNRHMEDLDNRGRRHNLRIMVCQNLWIKNNYNPLY